MSANTLFWPPRARQDRIDAIDYIAIDSPQSALNQLNEIERQIEILSELSELGRPGRRSNTRELVIRNTPFVVIYRINRKAKRIELIRVLHSAQLWP
jgi:toxin ParE1/3/4